MNLNMIFTLVHVVLFIIIVIEIRRDLSLGNGAAAAAAWVLLTLICGIFVSPTYVFLLIAFVPFIPLINGVFFKLPIVSDIFIEMGILLKKAARAGIPHSKIEEAIFKKYGVKLSELKDKDSKL